MQKDFGCKILIDGKEMTVSADFTIRFVESETGPIAVLYFKGHRVVESYSIILSASAIADPWEVMPIRRSMNILTKLYAKTVEIPLNVVVVGDFLFDYYYNAEVKKLSAESPVPVFSISDDVRVVPGGAGNVCRQLLFLNCNVSFAGILSKKAKKVLEDHHVDTTCSSVGDFSVPAKQRILAEGRQLSRYDFEDKFYGLTVPRILEEQKKISLQLNRFLNANRVDVVILSDYGKGVLGSRLTRPLIDYCNHKSIPVIVDPKGADYSRFSGSDTIKLNLSEASAIATSGSWKDCADLIQMKTKCRTVVITRGSEGPFCKIGHEYLELEFRPCNHKAVSTVGAGDCFAAWFAISIARGFNWHESVSIAHTAAYEYTKRLYAEPVLVQELWSFQAPTFAKLANASYLDLLLLARLQNKKIVFTNGVFDALHPGHASFLEWSKLRGDVLIVGVNSDASARRIKGKSRPVFDEAARLYQVASLACVDYVVKFDDDSPEQLIKKIRPAILTKGSEYKGSEIPGEEYAGEVNFMPEEMFPYHTTSILEKLKS